MDIGFTEEQELLRTSARRFLENECPTAFVRQRMAEPAAVTEDFWQKLAAHLAETNPVFKGMTARQVFDKRVADITPMKREQTPEDIGWAAVFLASDEARNITGQALNVDGGVVMQ